MSHAEQDLIRWKTDAWKKSDMVAWYSKRMFENSSTVQLKNKVEVALCERYATGQDVLDVGIGTGRASLGLAAKGVHLTGVDSSQAMLDECRRLAGDTPIDLMLGDVTHLPLPEARFDSLISLNVVTHFPHVEDILREWQRVVRPDGRLVFDIYSLDHLRFARGQDVTLESLIAERGNNFNMHVSAQELVSIANRLGLKIVALVPYGSCFSGEYYHWHFPIPLQESHWWRRQLSWISMDNALFDMALFLDQHLFGCLTSITTGRFMVVLENARAERENEDWLARNDELNAHLVDGTPTLDSLAHRLDLSPDAWRAQFDRHLDRIRNRGIAYFLLTTFLRRVNALDWRDLAPRNGAALDRWVNAETVDSGIYELVRTWHQAPDMAGLCAKHGVDMASGLEYELQRKLIKQFTS